MKVVSTFYGRVNQLNQPPELSFVTLKNEESDEVYDTTAMTEKLLEKGIDYNDCEFKFIINQSIDGTITSELVKLDPKSVSKEKV